MTPYNKYINRYVIGISQQSFIEDLIREGYRNFFFGFILPDYLQKYGSQLSLNRRYYIQEQFTDFEIASKVIEIIHKKGGKIHLTLNPIQTNKLIFDYIKQIFNKFKDLVDGVVVSNISTLKFLQEQHYENIVLSNLFGFYSISAIDFFVKNFSIKRIVLPRDVEISFIKDVAKNYPDLEIEVFLYGDNCMFSEAFCFAEHGYSNQPVPLCSFSTNSSIPVEKPKPDFKHKILTKKEDIQNLKTKKLDIDTLLDSLYRAYNNHQQEEIEKILEYINQYDTEYLSKYYDKLKFSLTFLNSEKAIKILSKLQKEDTDTYAQFHKLNLTAVEKIIENLKDFENIYFKIPSRGRNFKLKIANYNYKESQYKL